MEFSSPELEETEPLPPLHPHTVLIVDDEPPVLAALCRTLGREPYDLITTENPWKALEFCELRRIDLVVSDQRMPGMTGLEVLQAIRDVSPGTTGVLLTGYPESVSLPGTFGSVVRRVLFKPWDDALLRGTLRRLLRETGPDPCRID